MSPDPKPVTRRVERVATYRLQLHEGFTFHDAAEIAPYLAKLGISHLYLSPILQSRPGSTHGYDVVDHTRLDEQLGGAEGFERLVDAWPGGIVVDIVPNHMAITERGNVWWWDVLKNGPSSPYATWFDIDWDPPEARLRQSILLPILGDHYGRVLEAGELTLSREGEEVIVRYYEHAFPIAPGTEPDDLAATEGHPDRLHELLEAQNYRLAYWKVAGHDLNYRRFFAINELAALRVEQNDVFAATHSLLLELYRRGGVDGFRVDHIDGLRYPADYLERLRRTSEYIVVEKILEGDEELPAGWPVEGTTGYEFLNLLGGLFVDHEAEKAFTDIYATFLGEEKDLRTLTLGSKLLLMDTELAADIERLVDLFVKVCEDQRRYRDFTRTDLRHAVRETLASFPVYRTYVDARSGRVDPRDERIVETATSDARERRPDLDPELFSLLACVLLLKIRGREEDELAMRFQQTSGPIMAKGLEDTLFYVYNRFIALNEVGGDPGHFGTTLQSFHENAMRAQTTRPASMLATSTHDTKRSEDVRARLAVLSEMPDAWGAAVERWARMTSRHHQGDVPDRNLEYLFFQTLVGAWPLSVERATEYLDKAAKECKEHTSWIAPNSRHDAALRTYVEAVLGDVAFVAELESFVAPLIRPGRINSLAQVLAKLTYPGIPDIYQGTETWDLSLVDPDNRRPVDHAALERALDEVVDAGTGTLMDRWDEGLPKLLCIHRTLAVRAAHPEAFGPDGSYDALAVTGAASEHICAYLRGGKVAVVLPRLLVSLDRRWADTSVSLPEGTWRNAFTGETESDGAADALFDRFPVALLTKED